MDTRAFVDFLNEKNLVPSDRREAIVEATSISGDRVIVGVSGDDDNGNRAGAAYIFENVSGKWFRKGKLKAREGKTEDFFGCAVSISGETAIVGAYGDDDNGDSAGAAYIP